MVAVTRLGESVVAAPLLRVDHPRAGRLVEEELEDVALGLLGNLHPRSARLLQGVAVVAAVAIE